MECSGLETALTWLIYVVVGGIGLYAVIAIGGFAIAGYMLSQSKK